MRRMMLILATLLIWPAITLAEPERIKDDATESPCDDSAKTAKPLCDTDSESIKVPSAMPTERDSVIVPPDIPAEGLPHQDGKPSTGNSPDKLQR
ncbi:MAG TPA: hypothetical protein VEA39_02385 [Methylophilaceae bacterium]|nr:hypothetical protein [Methylophilaceae bacterium]